MKSIDYFYKEVEVKKYLRTYLDSGETSIVRVSNRNNLPEEEHLRLLNFNTPDNELYSKIIQLRWE